MERADLPATPLPQLTLVPCFRHTRIEKPLGFLYYRVGTSSELKYLLTSEIVKENKKIF